MKAKTEIVPFGVLPVVALPKDYSVDVTSIEQRDLLLIKSKGLPVIVDAATNEAATNVGVEIRRAIKAVEESRKIVKAPYLEACKKIDFMAQDFIASLVAEQTRLENQAAVFRRQENDRIQRERQVAEAEQRRLSEAALEAQRIAECAALKVKGEKTLQKAVEAQGVANAAKETFMTAVAAPVAEVQKPRGSSFRQVQKFIVVDIKQVYAANPSLCKPLEISPSAVKAICFAKAGSTKENPDRSVPGLSLYFEDDLSFSSR